MLIVKFITLFYALQNVNLVPLKSDNTLILVNVLFRHGNRTPEKTELYPNDPYINETYFPFGLGQLTNSGKQREYQLGINLRKRYDEFLGNYYYPAMLEASSTNYDRTKASLQLVLAGLFPPKTKTVWNKFLNWQPIPYKSLEGLDRVLLGVLCPYYLKLYNISLKSPRVLAEFSKFKDVTNYLSNHTGKTITSYVDVYNLAFGLRAEEDWGFVLPQWTESVWPRTIMNLAVREYFVAMNTKEMRQMATGYFLKKLIDDCGAKINGSEKKLYLYSAHESNIAELLITLGIFNKPHMPDYSAYIVIELHKINDVYGIKIFYENYTGSGIQKMKLPGCEEFCELEKFKQLYDEYIPKSDICIGT